MKSVFNRNFWKIQTALQNSAYGKWKMDLFLNKIRFKFGLPGQVAFENGAFKESEPLYLAQHCITMAVKTYNTHSRKRFRYKLVPNWFSQNLNIYNNTITIDSRVRASKAVLSADIEASKNWFKYHLRERQREAFKM